MNQARRINVRNLLLTVLMVFSMLTSLPAPVQAEGTRDLNANAGKRALTEWRTNQTAGLYRRTFFRVYARAGEKILMGSSAMGVGSGNIVGYKESQISNSQIAPMDPDGAGPLVGLNTIIPEFDCKLPKNTTGTGKLDTRAKELAGPKPASSSGYDPCIYTAPETGTYWVAMYGPDGPNGSADGDAGTIDAPVVGTAQRSGVSMWDITVRNAANTTTINGRVFVDYLAQITGGNGTSRRINSTLYSVTGDGFIYKVDMRGLDPNGYIFYGNRVGFLDPDGKTPLYHDMWFNDSNLAMPKGETRIAPASAKMFFKYPAADLPASILPTPVQPNISNISFTGSATGTNAYYSVGGEFTYSGNIGGINEIIISYNGVNFDPTNSQNRVLYAQSYVGVNSVTWDGKSNAGTPFPVANGYKYKMIFHAGEYHFPMLDVENSILGGPTITLMNPIGGTCPLASCRHAFYDDRGYKVSTGVLVGTPGTVLPGDSNSLNPPTTAFSNMATGYDTGNNQRAFGNDTGTGFGNWKGLDLWTYYPVTPVEGTLNIIPQVGTDLRLVKSHASAFNVGASGGTFTQRVTNSGSAAVSINSGLTVTDTLPAGLTYRSASGTNWTCSASGPTVTCSYGRTFNLAIGASLEDISLVVDVAASAAPAISNTASLNFSDSNLSNNTYTDTAVVNSADIAVTKSVLDNNPAEGGTITFTVTAKNLGPSDAEGVVVTDLLPTGLTFASYSATQGSYDFASGEWTVGTLPNQSLVTLTIDATVNTGTAGSAITNTASRSGGSLVDYDSSNDSASAVLTVQGTSLTGIITDEATGTPVAGATVTVVVGGNTYTAITGADGRYTIAGLAAGSATVTVTKEKYAAYSTSEPITITSGIVNTFDVALQNADLVLMKTDNVTTTTAGSTLTYTITVVNTGSLAAGGVVVTDTVGSNLSFVSCDNSCNTSAWPTVTWTLGANTIDPGSAEMITLKLLAEVVDPLPEGTASVSNYATVSTTSPESDVTDNEQADIDQILSGPDLQVSIDDSLTQVVAGETITYTINYQNIGNAASDGSTQIVIQVPAGLTDFVLPSECTGTGPITCTLDPLAPGSTGTLSLSAKVTSGTTPETILAPSATISDGGGNGADQDPSNNAWVDSDRVVRPLLALNKSMSSPARLGSEVMVTLSYQNTSSVTAANVTLTDTMPTGATYVADSCAGPTGTSCSQSSGTVSWTIGSVLAGASGTVSFQMTLAATAGGATAAPASFGAPGPGGSVVLKSMIDSDIDPISGLWQDSDPLGPTGWADNPRVSTFDESAWLAPNGLTRVEGYWLSASTLDANWIGLKEPQLNPNYSFFRGKVCVPPNAAGLQANLDLAGDDVSDIYLNGAYIGQQIGGGGTAAFSMGGAAQNGLNLLAVRLRNNRHGGHAAYGGFDSPGLLFRADLSWDSTRSFVSVPRTVKAGTPITFNVDPAALGGVGSAYKFVFGDESQQDYSGSTSATHTYSTPGTYTAQVLVNDPACGETFEDVEITVLGSEANLVANTASASYTSTQGTAYAATSGSAVDLPLADLFLLKSSSPSAAVAGQNLTYTLIVINQGPRTLTELTLLDPMPEGFVASTYTPNAGSYDPQTGKWTDITLASGGNLMLTISGQVDPLFVGSVVNTATLTSDQASDTISANNTASVTNAVSRPADLGVDVSGEINSAAGTVTLTITVTNNGSAGVTSFTLEDVLPVPFTNPRYTPAVGTYDPASNTWSDLTLLTGDSITLTVVVDVTEGWTGSHVYTASINGITSPLPTTDAVSSNNSDFVTMYHDPTAITLGNFSARAGSFWDWLLGLLGIRR